MSNVISEIIPEKENGQFTPSSLHYYLIDINALCFEKDWTDLIFKALMDMRFPSMSIKICLNIPGMNTPEPFTKKGMTYTFENNPNFPCAKRKGFILGAPIFFEFFSRPQ